MAWFGDWLRKKENELSTGVPRCAGPARVRDVALQVKSPLRINNKKTMFLNFFEVRLEPLERYS